MVNETDKKLPIGNRLLAILPENEFSRVLLPHLESVELRQGQLIYAARQTIDYAYFPVTALLSRVVSSREGDLVEAGICGNEAMAGVTLLLGQNIAPYLIQVQIAGTALRVKAEVMKNLCSKAPSLQNQLLRYAHTAMVQLAQTAICNRFHTVEQRLSRWLLVTHDRIQSDQIPMTREILAAMIGAGRPRVSIVVGALRDAGLIRSRRGTITIINRKGLEKASCECYQVLRKEIDTLLNPN
ncbi:MAG TPA: Crp/Fnr family transcriptional regulator [Blastocatellia bacterium]|nr:Crp/Fnr family transcriptional regulator [Blastocatellia bacterium]